MGVFVYVDLYLYMQNPACVRGSEAGLQFCGGNAPLHAEREREISFLLELILGKGGVGGGGERDGRGKSWGDLN